ncbi:VOC family protein [Nocardioides campestrisoli]|uniref:VOC family protein n=1 Tax=Nocardioides campestrisoli TaxID=2736757 RepID=UPI00163D6632|nr:VOC family protein [Nocardioides campestrisoli]
MSAVREFQVTFDAHDPDRLARFWAEALGYRLEPPPAPFASWDQALEAWGVPPAARNSKSAIVPPEGGAGPRVFFQQVPEAKTAKNRVHLDLRAAQGLEGEAALEALETECTRLVGLGAVRVRRSEPGAEPGSDGYLVMTDPEGNEFCLD